MELPKKLQQTRDEYALRSTVGNPHWHDNEYEAVKRAFDAGAEAVLREVEKFKWGHFSERETQETLSNWRAFIGTGDI